MTDRENNMIEGEEQRLQANRKSHLEWLRAQHAEYEAHRLQFAEGSFGDTFTLGGEQLDDDVPVYRSMSVAGPSEIAHDDEDEPVYRGAMMHAPSKMASTSLSSPVGDPSSSWVAARRPPLLRRQNAFAFHDSRDPTWTNLLDANENPSGQ